MPNVLDAELVRLEQQVVDILEAADYGERDWVVVYDSSKQARTELWDSDVVTKGRNKARNAYWLADEHIRRVVDNVQNYVIGTGFTFTPTGEESTEDTKKITQFWKKWCRQNRFNRKQRECAERGELDGEIFLRFRETDSRLLVRFLEVEDIRDPEPNTEWTMGIKYDKKDVEDVEAYAWAPDPQAEVAEWLSYTEVQHIIVFGSHSMVRGIPPLIPVTPRSRSYGLWLRDRLILNKLRARIAVIRHHIGATKSQVESYANSPDGKGGGTETGQTIFKPGTIIDTTGREKWEFLAPNINASDVKEDGRNIMLAVASGVGQSEVMVSADASNANFSSTWIAEAPPVKNFEAKQGLFIEEFALVWHRVMIWGQKEGVLEVRVNDPETALPEDGSGYEVTVTPPTLVERDALEDTKKNQILHLEGVLSAETGAAKEGLDYDKERENLAAEEANSIDMGHDREPDESLDTDDEENEGEEG